VWSREESRHNLRQDWQSDLEETVLSSDGCGTSSELAEAQFYAAC
jgi:hypothetical protein